MNGKVPRREFLGSMALAAVLPTAFGRALATDAPATVPAGADAIPIIDTHIHLFDPTRPQGVPWPSPDNKALYQPSLPARYREVTKGLNVVGAIEVECSTWLEDNQWVLNTSEADKIMVGTIGNLDPGSPEFGPQLDRFRRNPLFRGIRYGNLWNRNLGESLNKPQFVAGLKMLADAGLVLDSANPTPQLLADLVRVTDAVPTLRVIVDHLPNLARPTDSTAALYDSSIKELAKRKQVFVKVSEVLHKGPDGKVAYDLAPYKAKLDEIYGLFGADHLLYGSDWPNSDPLGTYPQVLSVVREYFMARGRDVAEKYFWKNSISAYSWVKRDPSQPQV
jgi:predicted TIM-barrel fold metal-dependent hydrolase